MERRLSTHHELTQFLMDDLVSTYNDFDDDSLFAYSIMANIAIAGDYVSESMFTLFMQPCCDIAGRDIVAKSAAFFHGARILSIICDCTENTVVCLVNDLENNECYDYGVHSRENGSPLYNQAVADVLQLRSIIYS